MKRQIKRLQSRFPQDADCILVTSEINQRYLTGFPFTDGYVLVSREKAWLLTDFRYTEAAKRHEDESLSVLEFSSRKELLAAILAENGFKTVGFEELSMTVGGLERLKADYPGITFVPTRGIIENQRTKKTPDEVENIVAAQRIAEKSLERLLGLITPDMTEKEVALELEYGMKKLGAEGPAFETIAVSGTASSMPHGVPRDVKLEKGFLTMDFGALFNGYCSDMTRTVVIGKADAEMKKVYGTVLQAQLTAEKVIREGATGRECDSAARDLINRAGYEGRFGHSLGHGVGMFIHEEPRLSQSWDKPLEKGHILTNEPGIYITGKYGVRIEDMIDIGGDGPVNLTRAPKELVELF